MRNKQKIKTLSRQFSQTMDGKLFKLQATSEILSSIFWWGIFKRKRMFYFIHLHENVGYALRTSYKMAKEISKKEIIEQLKAYELL